MTNRIFRSTSLLGAALALLALFVAATAHAQTVSLVGANLFPTNSSGAFPGGDQNLSTNNTTGSTSLLINGHGKGISFPLSEGLNQFTFTADIRDPFSLFYGLNLFFNTTGVSYNPPHTGVGIPGDLSVFNASDGSAGFATIPAGANVQSYETDGGATSIAKANGQSFAIIGNWKIYVTAFSVHYTDRQVGSFTLLATRIVQDVTAKFQITRSAFRYNSSTRTYVQRVTIKNIGSTPITGPISLVLDNLSSNASLPAYSGITAVVAPLGSPYVNFVLSGATLAPGGTATVGINFDDPTNALITYTPRILAGAGIR